jgi:hypothetical protein
VQELSIDYKKNVLTGWILQNAIRDTICKPFYDFKKKETPPRIFFCSRFPVDIPQSKNIEVHKNLENRKAYYKNLMVCGSVWSCPICSLRISTQRVKKLQAAIKYWQELLSCHRVLFVTSTIPHTINQSLHQVRSSFMSARRRMREQKILKRTPGFMSFNEICENFGLVGSVSGMETTYGKNGWHYHSHEIFFLSWELSSEAIEKLRELMVIAWKRALVSEKVAIKNDDAFFKRSIDIELVSSGSDIASYISKTGGGWTASHEVAKSQVKKGRMGSMSIFDLARGIAQAQDKQKCQKLIREFSKEMFGKRQLFFSKGMASLLHYDEDEELEDGEGLSELLGIINQIDWQIIRKKELRGEFLQICETSGFDSAINFIKEKGLIK